MAQFLTELTIKNLFAEFDETEQLKLLRELMRVARIDSIIQNKKLLQDADNHELGIPQNETPDQKEEREYRRRFINGIYLFLPSFLTVIKDDYIDACFELYKLIVKGSKGIDCISSTGNEEGDDISGIYAYDITDTGDDFMDEYTQRVQCTKAMIVGDMQNRVIFSKAGNPKSYLFMISFKDLFVNLYNKGHDVYIILFLLGFFEHNDIMLNRTITRMKELFFENMSDADARGNCFALSLRGGITVDRSDETKKKLLIMFPGFKIMEFDQDEW